ncbi:MAG TPA: hypothetical protein VGO57_08940 [Verrucomicrobiae bacterium]
MQLVNHRNRQWRLRLRAATAALSLGLWLFLLAAETIPSLHAWMHGGAVPDHDDCAVVALALGHVDSPSASVPVILPVTTSEIVVLPEFSEFHPTSLILPDGRAPPAASLVS